MADRASGVARPQPDDAQRHLEIALGDLTRRQSRVCRRYTGHNAGIRRRLDDSDGGVNDTASVNLSGDRVWQLGMNPKSAQSSRTAWSRQRQVHHVRTDVQEKQAVDD